MVNASEWMRSAGTPAFFRSLMTEVIHGTGPHTYTSYASISGAT